MEAQTTRRVLERVPDAALAWRPHEKSRTMGALAFHVATVPGRVAALAATPSPAQAPGVQDPPDPKSAAELAPGAGSEHRGREAIALGTGRRRADRNVAAHARQPGAARAAACRLPARDHAEPLVSPPRPADGLPPREGRSASVGVRSERGREPVRLIERQPEQPVDRRVDAGGRVRDVLEAAPERVVVARRRPVDPERRVDRAREILGPQLGPARDAGVRDRRARRVRRADDLPALDAAAREDRAVVREVVAAGLAVQVADRAAELARDDDERLVEEGLARRLPGCRPEVADEARERGVELADLRVEVRRRVLVVELLCMSQPPTDTITKRAPRPPARSCLATRQALPKVELP